MKPLQVEIGKVYFNWKVLEIIETTEKKQYRRCLLLCMHCDNNSIQNLTISELMRNTMKYCKVCSKKNHKAYNNKDIGELSISHYHRIHNDANVRGLLFEVTQEYLWDLFQKQLGECSLSGRELVLACSYKNPGERTASLDRIDSSKGYIEGNVQWVHKDINQMKWNFTQEEFLQRCREIVQFSNINFNKYNRLKPLYS